MVCLLRVLRHWVGVPLCMLCWIARPLCMLVMVVMVVAVRCLSSLCPHMCRCATLGGAMLPPQLLLLLLPVQPTAALLLLRLLCGGCSSSILKRRSNVLLRAERGCRHLAAARETARRHAGLHVRAAGALPQLDRPRVVVL